TFDRLVARRLSLADLRCKNADALKDLERELPRDEQGKTLDWQQLLVAGAIESCRNDSGLALAAAKGETRRFAPYLREVPGLAERLGKRLQTAEELVPSVKIRLQDSPLPPSAHNQLIFKAEDELTLQRFRSLRNKAVHWLAPVPASTAHDLAKLFAKAANFLLPLVSEQVERDLEGRFAELRGFREWAAYLDRAARGDVAQELRPLSFSEVAARVGLELEMSEDGKGAG
ncbi:MAG TPA: hypothetical protein PK413_06500, partial [Thermoanaerobaculia bacterium]|nr:hypothetical protein [Thermoanaerobaculia bacterium]